MQAIFEIVHGAAHPFTPAVSFPVMDRQHHFRVLGHHPEKGGHPHPEDRARAADGDGGGHPHDVAHAERSRQRRRYRLKGRNGPRVPVLLPFEDAA